MNKKALTERKQSLISQLEGLGVELETRALTDEEQATFDDLTKQIAQINQALAQLAQKVEEFGKTEQGEDVNVNKDNTATEVRSLLASENGGVLSQNVFQTLFEKAEYQDEIVDLMETISNNGESLTFVVEDSTAMLAQAKAEGVAVDEVQPILKPVKLVPDRKGAQINLSKEFLAGVGNASYEAHAQEQLVQAVNRKRQLDMVNAIKSNSAVEKIVTAATGTISIDDVANLILSAPEGEYTLIGDKNTIVALKKLKDTQGHFYVQSGNVNGKLQSVFLGIPLKMAKGFGTTSGSIGLALVGKNAVKEVINSQVEIEKIQGDNVAKGIKSYNIDYMNAIEVVEEDYVKVLEIA